MSIQRGARHIIAVALAVLGLAVPALALAQASEYHAELSGSTSATGSFTISVDGETMAYTLTVPSITATTQAHIHAGAASESGPVVVPLFAAEGGSASSIDASGSFGAADLGGPYAGDLSGFMAALNDGTLYVNVHTEANPAGEIRGQIVTGAAMMQVAPPASGNAGLAAAASTPWSLATLLVAAAVALTLGGRVLTAERRAG